MWILAGAEVASEASSGLDPVLTILLSVFGGAALTALAGLFAAWRQGRREHERWVREQRYEAYIRYLTYSDAIREVLDEYTALPKGANGQRDFTPALTNKFNAIVVKKHDSLTPIRLVGPTTVRDCAKALEALVTTLEDAPGREERIKDASKALREAMQAALDLKQEPWIKLPGRRSDQDVPTA